MHAMWSCGPYHSVTLRMYAVCSCTEMRFLLFYCCYLSLTLCYASQDINTDHENHRQNHVSGTCQNLDIVMVQNLTQTGMILRMYQASTMSLSAPIPVPNQYLPPECGDNNHRCGILHFEHSEISYYIIPSIRGFVKFSHHIGDAHQDPQISVINVTEECNPVRAFLTGPEGSYRIVIACMDLQIRPYGVIYYLQYYFSPAPDTKGRTRGVIKKNTSFQVRSEPIYYPDTVSKVIYVRGQKRCEERRNLYFIDDAYVLQYSPDAFDPEYTLSSTPLQNCVGYQGIEHYGNDSLLIRCFNNQTVMYDSCAGRFNYLHSDHVPYPCSNWDTIIYRDGRKLTLHKRQHSNNTQLRTLSLPKFDKLTYGTCIHAYDGTPIFIGIANDGEIFVAHFGISNVTTIEALSGKNVFRGNGSISWHPPIVFSENRQVFGVYNVDDKDFQVVNVTAECSFVHRIGISDDFAPDLVAFTARNGSYECSCQVPVSNTHRSSSIKWPLFGIPAIGALIILLSLGILAAILMVYLRKKLKRRAESLCSSFYPESNCTDKNDMICVSGSDHRLRQQRVQGFPVTMQEPVEVTETHNVNMPNNDHSRA